MVLFVPFIYACVFVLVSVQSYCLCMKGWVGVGVGIGKIRTQNNGGM
jgi:hypothetical protein